MVRAYILRKLVGEVDREALLEKASEEVINDITTKGFTPADEAVIDAALNTP
jgi:hypothetical protein